MHHLRVGERHRPARAVGLNDAAVAFLRLCDIEVGSAWATDRLTDARRRLESEARLLRSYATEAECKAVGRTSVDAEVRARLSSRLATDARYQAALSFIELAREAEASSMTLVYDDEPISELPSE